MENVLTLVATITAKTGKAEPLKKRFIRLGRANSS